jgi:DNA topoisomerase-1
MSVAIETAQVIQLEPEISAKIVGLRYVEDESVGIRRERVGEQFQYKDVQGRIIHDSRTLARIKALVIPPAWTQVWICPDENGHLQATGRDVRGRKQHRYHPRWREVRDETKYNRAIAFAKALPRIRRRVSQDLKLPGLPRNKVLATVIRLLEVSLIRVGNEEYARANRSFGLTTMRDRHVKISGSTLQFHFRGKSGKEHTVNIDDKRLARIVKNCQDIPGQELFQYLDAGGQRQGIGSGDVNEYLREISGAEFSTKDFRTWAGTVLAAIALAEFKKFDTQTQAKKNIVQAIERVAARLGNTPSVCRKCYVHPAVLDAFMDGELINTVKQRAEEQMVHSLNRLRPEEAAVLTLLQQRLSQRNGRSLRSQLTASLRAAQRRNVSASPGGRRVSQAAPARREPPITSVGSSRHPRPNRPGKKRMLVRV